MTFRLKFFLFGLFLFGWLVGDGVCAHAQVLPVPPEATTPPKNQDEEAEVVIRSELITVLTAVSAANGQPIAGLSENDFEILEDGVPQTLSSLGRQENQSLALVLMLDTSSSVRNRLKLEQDAALNFIRDILRTNDRAALYAFNHDISVKQDLTGSLKALESAVGSLSAKGATAIYDAVFLGARRLVNEKGRRVIVVVSDGYNTISRTTVAKTLEEVSRSDAIVYGICPVIQTQYDQYVKQPQNDLELLCRQTGGRTFYISSPADFVSGFAQLAAEIRAQYVLTYSSTNEKRDGTFRKIEVRVKRPGVRIRARNGYYAPQE
jgi:Ca-activated chloride channel homolog